jgi:hypothetical protein
VLISLTLSTTFPYPFLSPPIPQQLSVLLLCLLPTEMQCISILFILSFCFPLPPLLSSPKQSHYWKNVIYIIRFIIFVIWSYIYLSISVYLIYISIHMIMFVFVCTFIFWIYLPHMTFVFLNLAYFAKHDYLQLHLFTCKRYNLIFLYGWTTFHWMCVYILIHH